MGTGKRSGPRPLGGESGPDVTTTPTSCIINISRLPSAASGRGWLTLGPTLVVWSSVTKNSWPVTPFGVAGLFRNEAKWTSSKDI